MSASIGEIPPNARVAVVVAHPDDETLWCGGLLLQHPGWEVFVGALCRGGDPDRAPKFFRALERVGADGAMADLDDGPDQTPQDPAGVRETVLSLLPKCPWDLVLTHGPFGEYTRHLRHEEVSKAVLASWADGGLEAKQVWLFAYADEGGKRLPEARKDADIRIELPENVWEMKRALMEAVYGFGPESWEVRATPRAEAFTRLTAPGPTETAIAHGEGNP